MHLVFWAGENIATRLGCASAGRLGGLGFDVDAISAVEGGGGGALPCSSDDALQLVEVDRRRRSKSMERGCGAALWLIGSLLELLGRCAFLG